MSRTPPPLALSRGIATRRPADGEADILRDMPEVGSPIHRSTVCFQAPSLDIVSTPLTHQRLTA